jgi:hypothetical protein
MRECEGRRIDTLADIAQAGLDFARPLGSRLLPASGGRRSLSVIDDQTGACVIRAVS